MSFRRLNGEVTTHVYRGRQKTEAAYLMLCQIYYANAHTCCDQHCTTLHGLEAIVRETLENTKIFTINDRILKSFWCKTNAAPIVASQRIAIVKPRDIRSGLSADPAFHDEPGCPRYCGDFPLRSNHEFQGNLTKKIQII